MRVNRKTKTKRERKCRIMQVSECLQTKTLVQNRFFRCALNFRCSVPCHLVSKPFRHISIIVERKHSSSSRQSAQKIITCRICLYGSFKDLNQPKNVDAVNLFLWKLKAFPHDLFIQWVRSYSWINSYVTESNLGLLIDQNEVTKHVWMFGSPPPPPPPTFPRSNKLIFAFCNGVTS